MFPKWVISPTWFLFSHPSVPNFFFSFLFPLSSLFSFLSSVITKTITKEFKKQTKWLLRSDKRKIKGKVGTRGKKLPLLPHKRIPHVHHLFLIFSHVNKIIKHLQHWNEQMLLRLMNFLICCCLVEHTFHKITIYKSKSQRTKLYNFANLLSQTYL